MLLALIILICVAVMSLFAGGVLWLLRDEGAHVRPRGEDDAPGPPWEPAERPDTDGQHRDLPGNVRLLDGRDPFEPPPRPDAGLIPLEHLAGGRDAALGRVRPGPRRGP